MTSELAKLATNGSAERHALLIETLTQLVHEYQTQSAIIERIAGNIDNHVIAQQQFVIPAGGSINFDYHVPAGTVILFNTSTHPMTYVNSGGGASTPPVAGVGVQTVPAGRWIAIPSKTSSFAIYGTATDIGSVHVLTSMAYGGGQC